MAIKYSHVGIVFHQNTQEEELLRMLAKTHELVFRMLWQNVTSKCRTGKLKIRNDLSINSSKSEKLTIFL